MHSRNLEKQCMCMQEIFLKTPLLIYSNFFPKPFPKLGVRLICECSFYAGIYGIFDFTKQLLLFKRSG